MKEEDFMEEVAFEQVFEKRAGFGKGGVGDWVRYLKSMECPIQR